MTGTCPLSGLGWGEKGRGHRLMMAPPNVVLYIDWFEVNKEGINSRFLLTDAKVVRFFELTKCFR